MRKRDVVIQPVTHQRPPYVPWDIAYFQGRYIPAQHNAPSGSNSMSWRLGFPFLCRP